MIGALVYAVRRSWWYLRSPEIACRVPRCPRPRVGYAAWCRTHTNEIMDDTKSPELQAALDDLGWRR